jgi:hypothetical protein
MTNESRFSRERPENYIPYNLVVNTNSYLPFWDFWETYQKACARSSLDFKHLEQEGEFTGKGLGKLHVFQAREKRRFFNLVAQTQLYEGVNPQGFYEKIFLYSPKIWTPREITSNNVDSINNKSLKRFLGELYLVMGETK